MSGFGTNIEGLIYSRLVEIKIVSDGDHNYIIPAGMKDMFYEMLDEAEDDPSEFNSVFGEYRKNPDDLKLYTDEI